MKLISNIIFLLQLIALPLFAQKHVQEPELDKFEGIWEYKNRNIVLRLDLKKVKNKIETDDGQWGYLDELVGDYSYAVDGKEAHYKDSNKHGLIAVPFYYRDGVGRYDVLRFRFFDLNNTYFKGYLTLHFGKDDIADFVLETTEEIVVTSGQALKNPFKLKVPEVPNNVTMTKVKGRQGN